MISLVPESTTTPSQDSKANDAPRRVLPSVDKFAEHLQRSKEKRSEKELTPQNSSKRFTRPPSEPETEFRPHAQRVQKARPADAASEDTDPVEDDTSESESSTDSNRIATCVTVALAASEGPNLVAVDPTEFATVDGTESDLQQPVANPQAVVEVPIEIAPEAASDLQVRTVASKAALQTVVADSDVVDVSPTASNEEEAAVAEIKIEAATPGSHEIQIVLPQSSPRASETPTHPGGDQLENAAASIKQSQTAFVTEIIPVEPKKESLKETLAQVLLGSGSDQLPASRQMTSLPIIQPIVDGLSTADSTNEDLDRRSDKESQQVAPERQADSTPILSPADAVQAAASTLPGALRRQMQSHSVSPAAPPATPPITDAQHARLLQRVSRAFRSAEERGGEVQIRLSPPELGSMKLELSLISGVLTAKLEVENQRAQTILLDSLGSLRERLADQGIRVEKFDVSLQQRDSGGQQPQQHPQQNSERTSRASALRTQTVESAQTQPDRSPQRPLLDASRLNVIV